MIHAIGKQKRTLNALILREMETRFGQNRFGYFWGILNPTLSVGVLFIVFSVANRLVPPGVPMLLYTVTGFLTWQFFSNTMSRVYGALEGNQALLMYPQVTTMDVILSRATLEMFTYTVVLLVLVSISMLVEGLHFPQNPQLAIASFWLAGALGAIIGMVISSIKPFIGSIEHIIAPVIRLGFFASGVLFAAIDIPPRVLPYLSWNPMFHIIEMMREGWFSNYNSPIGDLSFVLSILFIGLAVALIGERFSRAYQFQ